MENTSGREIQSRYRNDTDKDEKLKKKKREAKRFMATHWKRKSRPSVPLIHSPWDRREYHPTLHLLHDLQQDLD